MDEVRRQRSKSDQLSRGAWVPGDGRGRMRLCMWAWTRVEGREAMQYPIVRLKSVPMEGYARLTDGGVHGIEEWRVLAGEVVPPVTYEVLLIEHGAVGTEERVLTTTTVANVEDLWTRKAN